MEQDKNRQLDSEQSRRLLGLIMRQIGREQKKADLFRTAFFSATLIISLLALFPVFNLLKSNLVASGFAEYFSLIFSDWEIVSAYWQNFSLSLLEVLPVMSLAAFLTVILILLESVRHLSMEISGRGIRFKLN